MRTRGSITSAEAYTSQIAVLAFMASVTFKVLMLPRYFAGECGRQSWIAMSLMMLLDTAMFAFVYKIACNGGIRNLDIPLWIKNSAIAIAVAGCLLKAVLFYSECIAYTATALFDEGLWRLIVAGFFPVLAYVAYKGLNVLARTAQVVIWLVGAVIAINVLLADFQGDIETVLPVVPSVRLASACDRYLFWFGDFTPFMFFSVTSSSRKKHAPVFVSLAFLLVFTVGFVIALDSVFGGGSALISFAFGKLAIFNKLSRLLGALDFPVVCVWLLMATVKLSLLLSAACEGLTHFTGGRGVWAVFLAAAASAWCKLAVGNLANAHVFFTGRIRYFAAVSEYVVPMAVYAAYEISRRVKARRERLPA